MKINKNISSNVFIRHPWNILLHRCTLPEFTGAGISKGGQDKELSREAGSAKRLKNKDNTT